MATLRRKTNGTWEIQFRDEYGQRKTITLSGRKFTERTARQLKDAVEVLIHKKINGDPTQHKPTQTWVEGAAPAIREKLARYDLCQVSSRHTVTELWDEFLDQYEFKTESTRTTYLHARERFNLYFRKPGELIARLTPDRMEAWKAFLLDKGYGQPTIAGTVRKTKTLFNWAVKQKLLVESPLKGVGEGSFLNPAKTREVTMVEYHRLLDACPCQEWRVIITLARIGGLRPCEIMVLRWSDIGIGENRDRMRVYSPKLQRFVHLREREPALFPKVSEELDKLRAIPGNEGQEYIINRYTNRERVNFGQPFDTIAKRAGLDKIVRPFDNMRASRATEILRRHGAKVESAWIGHSEKIAEECYLMVTEEDYAIATGKVDIGSE